MSGGPNGRKSTRTRTSRPRRAKHATKGNRHPGRPPAPSAGAPRPSHLPALPPPAAEPVALAAARAATRLTGVERRLDTAIDGLESMLHDVVQRAGKAGARATLRQAISRLVPAARARLEAAIDLVRLLEPPAQLDRYGMDRAFARRLEPVIELICSSWWRVEVRDAARLPSTGPAIVVANHAGVVPWDALVLSHAVKREHPAHREVRPLLDDRECALPVFGAAAIRAGAVRASPEAAERILSGGDVVGVFPEGSAGARKPWRERYRLLRFGRGGFAKLALRTGAPVVPCAIVGSEEASHGLSRPGWLAERLGLPLFATNPSLRLAVAAAIPLPSRWSLHFGEPVDLGAHGPAGADDASVVSEIAERVRSGLQAMLDEVLAARASVYL